MNGLHLNELEILQLSGAGFFLEAMPIPFIMLQLWLWRGNLTMMGSSSTWSPRILRLSYQLASVYGFIDSFNWILDPLLETIIPSQTVWSCSCSHIPRKKQLTDWDPSACSLWCHGEEMSGGTVPVLCIQRAERPSSGMPWIRVAPRSFFGVAKSWYKTMCLCGARGTCLDPTNGWVIWNHPFMGGWVTQKGEVSHGDTTDTTF